VIVQKKKPMAFYMIRMNQIMRNSNIREYSLMFIYCDILLKNRRRS